jgi:hypothetical protein
MEYWILQNNPTTFKPLPTPPLPGVPPNIDYWRIRRYADKLSFGDLAFIWQAGSRSNRGIYNVAKIISAPPHKSEAEKQIRLLWKRDRPFYDRDALIRLGQYPAILIKYRYPDTPGRYISVEQLERRRFANLPVIQMPQSGIYSLDQTSGERLLKLIQQRWGKGKDC